MNDTTETESENDAERDLRQEIREATRFLYDLQKLRIKKGTGVGPRGGVRRRREDDPDRGPVSPSLGGGNLGDSVGGP